MDVFTKIFTGKLNYIYIYILFVYGLPKVSVTTIMMLYVNMKAIVHSPDDDTDFFDIVNGVLQENTLYIDAIFIHNRPWSCALNVKRSDERKWFHSKKKAKSRWCPTETITDADYANDLVLLANTPA